MKPLAQNTLIQNRYLVVQLIGKGGMGEVYLAVDQRLGSAVALKRTFFAGDEMLGNAFEREARTLARMRHPVLPKVSDHFGEGDEQYLVMEHISGDDLSKRLEAAGKPFPVSWVLFWADQLLDALSYLHTHEPPIIHRDIKPQNLKLTDENHVILLDFGLSKTSTGQTNISQSGSTGSVVGYTPHYAPMEQIRGIGTSPRSDLYSLSATLYQLMTNSVPVDALSRADSMLNELPDPIKPPHELNPEVPPSVSEVLLRAMEVSQEKRYANAREMQRVLRKAFNDIQQATTANTVAFTAEEAGVVSASIPAADVTRQTPLSQSNSDTGTEAPAIEPDASIDLDATMAYGAFESGHDSLKQSDVRTEVFVGGTSEPVPEVGSAEPEAAPVPDVEPPAANTQENYDAPPDTSSFNADATVPFFAVDQADIPSTPSQESPAFPATEEPEFFDSEPQAEQQPVAETAYFTPAEPDPAVAASAPYVASAQASTQPAAQPGKKSSGKVFVIFGILAALLLVGVAVAGGIWAYVNYAGAPAPTPTPEPSPTETVTPSPSPEPTVESNVNANTGNSNVGNGSIVNDNSNSIVADPTPVRTPVPDEPTGTRPTPRPAGTPARPVSTPGPRATPAPKKTPAGRPKILQ